MKGTPLVQGVLEPVGSGDEPGSPEVSVVIPCLNEAETVGICIEKAARSMRAHGISGEIVVADNGSSDDSRTIAHRMGAVVVDVESKGYGHALMAGIAVARGKFVVMGDADDSYDFAEIPTFVESAPGVRSRPGLPVAERRRHGVAGSYALAAPVVGKPDVLAAGAADVPRHSPRRLLRNARLHQSVLQPARSTLYRNGVRDGDDHQGQPFRRQHRGGADHAASGRPDGAPSSSQNVPRWLADDATLPDLQSAMVVSGARRSAHSAGPHRVRHCHARAHRWRCHIRRAHAVVLEHGDSVRLSSDPLRAAFDDVWCHGAAAANESSP